MFIIPFLPDWLFEGPRRIKHWPRKHICGDCSAPWTDGHICEPQASVATYPPLQGELRRLEQTNADVRPLTASSRSIAQSTLTRSHEEQRAIVPTKPRDRILATATRLFLEDGIYAVGVSRIIAEAAVAPMTLYRQFSGKDQLVAAVLEGYMMSFREAAQASLALVGGVLRNARLIEIMLDRHPQKHCRR